MDQKQFETLTSMISAATDKLQGPLNALALVELVNSFYTQAERTALLKEIDGAYAASNTAYEAMKAGPSTGPDMTNTQKAEHQRLLDAKVACDRVLDRMRKEHKLLFRLREARDIMGKGKYE